MTDTPTPPRRLPLRLSDLRGLSRLAVAATHRVQGSVAELHHSIGRLSPPLGPDSAGTPGGLTGLVYRLVQGGTTLSGAALEQLWRAAEGLAGPAEDTAQPARDTWLAALNGVWGDQLAASGNPLAIPMRLRLHGQALDTHPEALRAALPRPGRRVLVWLHGLCMHDGQWTRQGRNHAQALQADPELSQLWLHYNSGLHIADNGATLSALLDELLAHWPGPLDELLLVGHSMGGLVARAAIEDARLRGASWLARLHRLVCLGTPHHGAALERGGHLVDQVLAISPYLRPFGRLAQARSAGITDLRWGLLTAADVQAQAASPGLSDPRTPTPLPAQVRLYLVAGTTAEQPRGLRHALLGDGLVSVASAFGRHVDPALDLHVPPARRLLLTRCHHWDLLQRPEVSARLAQWLA